ncbi:MAG: hypothetical protein ACHBN1_11460 [Heteroscytonema crispum UTEX LB 1556]
MLPNKLIYGGLPMEFLILLIVLMALTIHSPQKTVEEKDDKDSDDEYILVKVKKSKDKDK